MRVRLACCLALIACGDDSGTTDHRDAAQVDTPLPAPRLALSLDRDPLGTPNPFAIRVQLEDPGGTPAPGRSVHITAAGAELAVTDFGDGSYGAVYTPSVPSGEVPIAASVEGLTLTAQRTALVLPTIGADWNQPEAVPGVVNSNGYEDSPEVSPDGEWLIVSSYSPIDPRCIFLQKLPADPECQSVVGPYMAPERPNMLGANRIVSTTEVHHRCDALCLTSPGGPDFNLAIPPLASFGFHRQPDDTFAEPFVIGFGADGFTYSAFGFNFVSAPQNGMAQLVFAKRPTDSYNEAFTLEAMLGAPILLSTFTCPSGAAVESSPLYVAPTYADPASTSHGNPGLRGGYLWFDDEVASPHVISVAPVSGTFPTISVAASTPVPIANPNNEDRVQPFYDGTRLYFGSSSNNGLSSAALTGDPSLAGSWSAPRSELGGEGPSAIATANRIAAIGEPSVAFPTQGKARLYFVYVIGRGGGVVDWNIGRVDHR